MKHYIPTLEETARAIIDNDDYSLYKRRRQLINEYSTGHPKKEDLKDGLGRQNKRFLELIIWLCTNPRYLCHFCNDCLGRDTDLLRGRK